MWSLNTSAEEEQLKSPLDVYSLIHAPSGLGSILPTHSQLLQKQINIWYLNHSQVMLEVQSADEGHAINVMGSSFLSCSLLMLSLLSSPPSRPGTPSCVQRRGFI